MSGVSGNTCSLAQSLGLHFSTLDYILYNILINNLPIHLTFAIACHTKGRMPISSVKFNDMNTQLHKHTITLIHINSELINTQCEFKINLNSNSNQNSK